MSNYLLKLQFLALEAKQRSLLEIILLSPNDCSRGCFWPESGVRSHFREPNVGHTDIDLRKNGSLWGTRHSLGANRISTVHLT